MCARAPWQCRVIVIHRIPSRRRCCSSRHRNQFLPHFHLLDPAANLGSGPNQTNHHRNWGGSAWGNITLGPLQPPPLFTKRNFKPHQFSTSQIKLLYVWITGRQNQHCVYLKPKTEGKTIWNKFFCFSFFINYLTNNQEDPDPESDPDPAQNGPRTRSQRPKKCSRDLATLTTLRTTANVRYTGKNKDKMSCCCPFKCPIFAGPCL